jgi:hypothetical protein
VAGTLIVTTVVLLPLATNCNTGRAGEAIGPDGVVIVARLVIPANPVLLMNIKDVLELPG